MARSLSSYQIYTTRCHERLVAIHELVEAILVQKRGISNDAITAFDQAYESARTGADDSEPGDDPTAPYHAEHCFATAIERRVAAELGVDWADYEARIAAL